jgi:hypothetical protein
MPKYRIVMREIVYKTYEIETPLTNEEQVMDYFYTLSPQEEIDAHLGDESDGWDLDEFSEVKSNA